MKKNENKRPTVGFSYGCIAGKLQEQALAQGFTLGKHAALYERCRKALIVLKFGIGMPDSVNDLLTKRLHNLVIKHLSAVSQKVLKNNELSAKKGV
jgi:hypothetical protein